jgi:hypothetical protein
MRRSQRLDQGISGSRQQIERLKEILAGLGMDGWLNMEKLKPSRKTGFGKGARQVSFHNVSCIRSCMKHL